jgi:hypothetical protein
MKNALRCVSLSLTKSRTFSLERNASIELAAIANSRLISIDLFDNS